MGRVSLISNTLQKIKSLIYIFLIRQDKFVWLAKILRILFIFSTVIGLVALAVFLYLLEHKQVINNGNKANIFIFKIHSLKKQTNIYTILLKKRI